MEVALPVGAIVIAALTCPAMMWWQRRRGRDAASCMPAGRGAGAAQFAELRSENERLSARLAELRRNPAR